MEDYSIFTGKTKTFSVVDYVLFGLTLFISASIGLVYAIIDRKKLSSKEYLFGGRQMSVIPVALSLLVTFLSAITLLGTPAEMYRYTTMYWYLCLSFVFAIVLSVVLFVPFFYKLGITSVFQYLEMRFNKIVRTMAVILFMFPTIIYVSFVLYAPSLAFNAVTGLDLWGSVVAIGAIATIYTTLGGMKAVLWTDSFQAVVILAGLLAVLIQGSMLMGGFSNAWEIAANRSRINFHDFDPDPTTRHSFWSIVFGGGFVWLSLYGASQAQIQRALSCPTPRKAQLAMLINLPGLIFIVSLCCMIGIVMFAFYADCYPLKFNNLIFSSDQLLPLFVMDTLSQFQGLPGVFVSCIFSGSLSTLSSTLNAMGAVIPHDLIQPFCCKKLSDRSMTILSKVTVFVMGGVTIACSYGVAQLGSVLQATYAVTSVLDGPVFGIFILGMFFPWANSWGAIVGCLTSLAIMLWICIAAFVNRAFNAIPSAVSVMGCNWNITTTTMTTIATTMSTVNSTAAVNLPLTSKSSDPFYPLYTLSYLNYTATSVAIVVIVGLIVSFITGRTDPKSLDPRLICPLFDCLFPCLPEMILRPLRFGVNHEGKYDVDATPEVNDKASKMPEMTPSYAADRKQEHGDGNFPIKHGVTNMAYTDNDIISVHL
ncbi:sodium-coupled monocarboxylate transporter 1-like isoform X1 [Haliotis rubra]|uniref:sodium-coupled monocarboxylate transporter 1-like isoform X1 n=2 Tax=Haliotis rubra TaxID=36100 RepID=UPI001EE5CFC6|nr:sodium-coupled monocarboxylate transporter 1-like isoform X1 [Haliotis rubra]